MPVSRPDFLPMIFSALELLDCDREQTSLLTYVDGDASLFLTARNLTEQSKFASRLCIQRTPDIQLRQYDRLRRRIRIAENANAMRELIPACDYVFSIEDDGPLPQDALKRLLNVYAMYPFAGLVSGVQIGRHGLSHVGAWDADDVYEPTAITSIMPGTDQIVEVDATGLYCALIKREHYVGHDFTAFDSTAYGPDIALGFALRRSGYRNYVDFGVPIEHRRADGETLTLGKTKIEQVRIIKQNGIWSHEVVNLAGQ
jgi:hypothetical protein